MKRNFKAKKEDKWGVIDEFGKVIIPFEYDELSHANLDHYFVTKGANSYFINDYNQKVSTNYEAFEKTYPIYSRNSPDDAYDQYFNVKSKGKWGILNLATGKEVISPIFDRMWIFWIKSQKIAKVKLNEKYGYIDNKWKVFIPVEFDEFLFADEYKYCARKGKKWHIVNRESNTEKILAYDQLINCCKGEFYIAVNKEKFGTIDQDGNVILPLKYDKIQYLQNQRWLVKQNNLNGVTGVQGELIIPIKYEQIRKRDASPYFVKALKENTWYYFDINGKLGKKEKLHDMPRKCKIVEKAKYDAGYINVQCGKKLGVMFEDNQMVIPAKYDEIGQFKDGYSKVRVNKKYGVIDLNGRTVISTKYEMIRKLLGGVAVVLYNNKFTLIDKNNSMILPAIYQNILIFDNNHVALKFQGKWGIIDGSDFMEDVLPPDIRAMINKEFLEKDREFIRRSFREVYHSKSSWPEIYSRCMLVILREEGFSIKRFRQLRSWDVRDLFSKAHSICRGGSLALPFEYYDRYNEKNYIFYEN